MINSPKVEVVEILEFSLPHSWRAKFDLEGFVPTANDHQELVHKCEALERSLPTTPKVQPAKGKIGWLNISPVTQKLHRVTSIVVRIL